MKKSDATRGKALAERARNQREMLRSRRRHGSPKRRSGYVAQLEEKAFLSRAMPKVTAKINLLKGYCSGDSQSQGPSIRHGLDGSIALRT